MKRLELSKWQLDPTNIKSEKVQFWSSAVMLSNLDKETAKKKVANGEAFVICGTAIGRMKYGYSLSRY